MSSKSAFQRFAPAILQVYRRDPEAFWAAVMAPFLENQVGLLDWLSHARVDLALLSAFRGLDVEARQILQAFGAPLNLDIPGWKSQRAQYLKDAYPVFAFLAVWMETEGQTELVERFDDILRAGVYAVTGYGILDANVDSQTPSPVEILAAQALIAEYETLALQIFGLTPVNLEIMHRMRTLFLEAEIKEKACRGKVSPYQRDRPQDLGAKGANSVTPYMLTLERLGRAHLIEDYWQVFLLFGAAIQMLDDWQDLEGDLACGHYSYVTLGADLPQPIGDPRRVAQQLRADRVRVRDTFAISQDLIAQSRAILVRLNEPLLGRLVDVTEARLETFFRKELRLRPDDRGTDLRYD